MADVKGVNYTLEEAGLSSGKLDRGVWRGKSRVYFDRYEAVALAIGSTIKLGPVKLQKGIRIKSVKIYHDALGAATIDVGDVGDPDRYIDGADVSAVGKADSDRPDGANYKVTGTDDDSILLTTIAAALNGTIVAEIETSEE